MHDPLDELPHREPRINDVRREGAAEGWRMIAIAMMTSVITLFVAWVAAGRNVVTRSEVEQMLAKDAGASLVLNHKVDDLRATVVEMRTILGVMAAKQGIPVTWQHSQPSREN